MEDTEKALRWYCARIGKRIPELDIHEKHCISMMYEYAKYYHEQQVKSVDLADVVCSYINDNLKISVEKNYEHSGMYGDNFVVSLLLDGQVISKSEFDVERFP